MAAKSRRHLIRLLFPVLRAAFDIRKERRCMSKPYQSRDGGSGPHCFWRSFKWEDDFTCLAESIMKN
jgi:hypothetical protein